MAVRIVVQSDTISKEESQRFSAIIEEERLAFERYITDHHLVPAGDFREYEIVLAGKLFGFLADGRFNPETRQITFYGAEGLRCIIHEWTHAAFPSIECDRHAEGLAFFVQRACSTQGFSFIGWESVGAFVDAYLGASNRERVGDWFDFLTNGSNFYDTRWGRLLIARAISTEFVTYLIGEIGLEGYLREYYDVIRKRGQQEAFEREVFDIFLRRRLDIIPKSRLLWDFFEVKARLEDRLSAYPLPERGSVLGALRRDDCAIGAEEKERARELALTDLRTTVFSANPEMWDR